MEDPVPAYGAALRKGAISADDAPTVAISGASGFVGQHLIRHLQAAGFRGHAISRQRLPMAVEGWSSHARSEMLGASVLPTAIDWFVHLEVKQHVPNPTARDREQFRRVNIEGTADWLRWCTRAGVRRFVYFSTIKAVGDAEFAQDETAATEPASPYGQSKRDAERLVSEWVQASPERSALVLRPAVVYGPGNTANVMAMVRAIDRGRFFLAGANTNVKSLVSVRNLCAAVSFLMSRMVPGVHICNIVDRESLPVRELAFMVARLLGKPRPRTLPLPLLRAAARVGDLATVLGGREMPLTTRRLQALVETSFFSGQKLANAGFVQPESTEAGLADMIGWYRNERT